MLLAKQMILGFLVIFFMFSLSKNIFEYQRNLQFYQSYKTEYAQVKEQNNLLKAQLAKTNDLYYIEKTIRDQLNLLKRNEVSVMLPQQTPTPAPLSPTPQPNYQLWYDTLIKE
jgi:cell division protein FtsB